MVGVLTQRPGGRSSATTAASSAVVAAVAGAAWVCWGATGLPSPAAAVLIVVGVAAGIGLAVNGIRQRRLAARADGPLPGKGRAAPMFATRRYRVVVGVEVAAIAGGSAGLAAAGHSDVIAVWVAAVVGVHLLVLGSWFSSRAAVVGALVLLASAAGLVTALLGARTGTVVAVTGLTSGVVFLSASVLAGRAAAMQPPAPVGDRGRRG